LVGIAAIAARLAWASRLQVEAGVSPDAFNGSGTIMKKIAVTVAVLALGLAACQPSGEANNAAETNVENAAANDVNAATDDAVANADAALNAAGNAVEDAGNAVENAGNAVSNAAENATN
jgi:hypothetical protein